MNATILVVDDDSELRATLMLTLHAAGYRVACAENGRAALDALESGLTADMVLLDLSMPEMDGVQFMRAVNDNARLRELPVVVLSSTPLPPAAGVPHLGKHMSIDHLLATIEATLRRSA